MDSEFCKYHMREIFTEVVIDEYVQQNCVKMKNFQLKRSFTPTHIKTYPNGDPSCLMDVQAINYTKRGVLLFKDYENNCCIDIYDEKQSNPYKCRIIGINGGTYHGDNNFDNSYYSIYETLPDVGSFVDKKPYLIYIDYTGLYIISAKKYSIQHIVENHCNFLESLKHEGSIIKISALDEKRTINNQPIVSENFAKSNAVEKNTKAFFGLNCSKDTPISYKNTFAPITNCYPLLNQLEVLTGLKLKTIAPSEKSAKKRIAEVLSVNEDQIFVKDGSAYLIDVKEKILNNKINIFNSSLSSFLERYYDKYQQYIPLISDVPDELVEIAESHIISIYKSREEINYFNLINRKCVLKPWDNI